MKVLFVKYSVQRNSKFQILTSILEEESGKLVVKKEAANSDAQKHIDKIYQNAISISQSQDVIRVPFCEQKQLSFISDYVHGISWEKALMDLYSRHDLNGFEKNLMEYRNLIRKLPRIQTNPSLCAAFQEYFGTTDRIFDCIELGHVDLILENIILTSDGGCWNIDPEWIIEAPIPVDFLMFRAASVFYNRHYSQLSSEYSVHDLLKILEVTENEELFAAWESSFSNYIHTGSIYEYHKRYLVNTTPLEDWSNKRANTLVSSIYYGLDRGFTEERSLKAEIRSDRPTNVIFRFSEPQAIKEIRWDPCEGIAPTMSSCHLIVKLQDEIIYETDEFQTNALLASKGYIFLTSDPQVLFSLPEELTFDSIEIVSNLLFNSYQDLLEGTFPSVLENTARQQAEFQNLQEKYSVLSESHHSLETNHASLEESHHSLEMDHSMLIENHSRLSESFSALEKSYAEQTETLQNVENEFKISEDSVRLLEHEKKTLNTQIALILEHASISNLDLHDKLLAMQKSHSWRITAPFRSVSRFIKKVKSPMAHGTSFPFTPFFGITESTPGLYTTTDNDPQFLSQRKYKAGFYFLTWNGMADRKLCLKMYPDYGTGYSEDSSVLLGCFSELRGHHERFIYLSGNASNLRIDPGEEVGTAVSITDFSYSHIGLLSALRIGAALEAKRTGVHKIRMLGYILKLCLMGKRREAEDIVSHVLSSYGDGQFSMSEEDAYQHYIRLNEPKIEEQAQQIVDAESFLLRPKISIVVPVYNTNKSMLTDMIESVRHQTYTNWELCLADGNSAKPHVKEVLQGYAKKDQRIKILLLKENLGIAGNSNAAFSLATGEYIALLDHDDLLPRWALFSVVSAINTHQEPDVLYSDEDKITFDGTRRFFPHFKPDWSPDLLRSYNYITHLFVAKRTLIDEVGRFLPGYDGSQDHDLILRATERANTIIHIPQILYHWRSHSESTAESQGNKSYTLDAGVRAITSQLNRKGWKGNVSYNQQLGFYQVQYELLASPLVSIIIPNYEHKDDLKRCIESIFIKSTYRNIEVIVVENNSKSDGIFAYYEEIKEKYNVHIVVWGDVFNYSSINNYAVNYAKGDVFLFLNNDTEVITPDWIERMLQFAQRDDIGAVGVRLLYPDDTIQHAGVVLGFLGVAGHSFSRLPKEAPGYMARAMVIQNVSAVTAACMMIRREVFQKVNGFDESLQVAFNDIDLCMKIRKEEKLIVYTPYAELYHHESISRGAEDTEEKQMRFSSEIELFMNKWGSVLEKGDPYYNPHLDLEKTPFRISGK